ncbi:P-II family nitrogen regulator [Halanaerobacter jeridensis]|uniref:Nitrogen regulatory protein PII 1 n=1 Tax=Halanaerobacter jeridensis TaxID=706427 RepID=A0A939BRY4_9FIRM|nr:P-II family nitrogen regulator [Halanaerobacter jeridensis]MBM7556521.1 nitrogen regulatory protein PII 1 [Halanaerobacter jeridensis]
MKLIRAIIRPEKEGEVLEALNEGGFEAYSKLNIRGRGKQKGVKVGETHYQELTKTMLLIVVEDEAKKEEAIEIIIDSARTETENLKASGLQVNMSQPGRPGDGKIFVSDINEAYTISDRSGL